MSVKILQGALEDRISELIAEGVRVDSIVTDPPYGIRFMGCAWDGADIENRVSMRRGFESRDANVGPNGGHCSVAAEAGKYDQSVSANQAFERWCEEWGRLALQVLKPGGHMVAFGSPRTHHRLISGLENVGFEIRDTLMWLFGSGFPKSKNHPDEFPGMGSALKPAWEPIILARKPLVGTIAANMRAHGVGMLDIDGCRIEGAPAAGGSGGIPCRQDSKDPSRRPNEASAERRYTDAGGTNFAATPGPRGGDPKGRWPANVAHDGSPEVVALFPSKAGAAAPVHRRGGDKFRTTFGAFKGDVDEQGSTFQGDAGSAARFFYCAKADRTDRNEGCEHLQAKPLNWSSGTESPGTFQAEGPDRTSPNHHPTVKPTDLMRWLVRMVTPKGGVVLDMFAGSGSTGKAAVLEGRDCILIEREAEYIPIIQGRMTHAQTEHRAASAQHPLFVEVNV